MVPLEYKIRSSLSQKIPSISMPSFSKTLPVSSKAPIGMMIGGPIREG